MDNDAPYHESVEQMAAHYLREVKDVQPCGPYWLGGHCSGSSVALEMARQLQEQGEEIGLLVLVDSEPPGVTRPSLRRPRYLAARLAQYWREGHLPEAMAWRVRVAAERTIIRRIWGGRQRRLAQLRTVHARAHGGYEPAVVQGDALLIRSSEYADMPSKDWHLQWGELLTGRLDVAVVSSTHGGLSQDSEGLANAIRAEMDKTPWCEHPSGLAVGVAS